MTPAPREDVPAFIQARVPVSLYQAVDAYAEALDVTLSEALRRLLVKALDDMGVKHNRTDDHGTRDVPLDQD